MTTAARGRCSWLRLAWASWFNQNTNNSSNRHQGATYQGRHRADRKPA